MSDVTITQKIPSVAKDVLNSMLMSNDCAKRYVSKTLTEINHEFNEIKKLEDAKLKIKLIILLTKSRIKDIKKSCLSSIELSHLENVISTISKIHVRELDPRYVIIDKDLNQVSKCYVSLNAAEKRKNYITNRRGIEYQIVTCNKLNELKYDKTKQNGSE